MKTLKVTYLGSSEIDLLCMLSGTGQSGQVWNTLTLKEDPKHRVGTETNCSLLPVQFNIMVNMIAFFKHLILIEPTFTCTCTCTCLTRHVTCTCG